MYLSGDSIISIKRKLENEIIPAPRGGYNWSKKTIDTILKSAKYTGSSIVHSRGITTSGPNIVLQNNADMDTTYESVGNNPAILSSTIFEQVRKMREERSNIVYNEDGTVSRKSTHYSSKKK